MNAMPVKLIVVLVSACLFPASVGAQTIRGTLMDTDNDRPIAMGLVILMSEDQDSITSTVTDEHGFFSVSSADPGSFLLLASAWGYLDTWAGIFELGDGGEITVEFRVALQPLPMDSLMVRVAPRGPSHHVLTSGFVQRMERGFGHFITPYEIENSNAMWTTDLFAKIPGLYVQLGGYMGDRILMRTAGSLCRPQIYVDGWRVSVGQPDKQDLNTVIPIQALGAAEIYTRLAQIPLEYAIGGYGAEAGSFAGPCGVILLWTKG